MKRIYKPCFTCVLCLFLLLSLAPNAFAQAEDSEVSAVPASEACQTLTKDMSEDPSLREVQITGTYRQTEARSMLTMINEFRASDSSMAWYWNSDDTTKTVFNTSSGNTLRPLSYDYALEQIAMERARELAILFDHVRPSGGWPWSIEYNGVKCWAENIAYGYPTAESVFLGWREDDEPYMFQGHRRSMLSPSYTAVGIGCFKSGGITFWTQEFGYASGTAWTAPNDSTVTEPVIVSTDVVSGYEDAPRPGETAPAKEGLVFENGVWLYYTGGEVDCTYTGLVENEYGWWYVKNGTIDYSYTGLAENEYGWWYVFNGKLDLTYTGLVTNESGTWYIYKGQLADWRTGFEWVNGEYCEFYKGQLTTWKTDAWLANPSGDGQTWQPVRCGKIDPNYTGLAENENGWWYVFDGKMDFSFIGLQTNDYGTWYVYKGQLANWRTGFEWVNGEYCEFYKGQLTTWKTDAWLANPNGDGVTWQPVRCGKIDPSYTGLAENENGWWYVFNGAMDFTYTGLQTNAYGTWYVYKGQLTTWIEDWAWIDGTIYMIYKGQLCEWYTGAADFYGTPVNVVAGVVVG